MKLPTKLSKLLANTTIYSTFIASAVLIASLAYNRSLESRASRYLGKKITYIDFVGLKHSSKNDLFDLIQIRPGDILNAETLNGDIKVLFNSGTFSRVDVVAGYYKDGVKLIFKLEEHPLVALVEFKGVNELNEQELSDGISIKEGEIFSKKKVTESIDLIVAKYHEEGFFNAIVKVRKKHIKESNEMEVSFLIDEGEDIKISKINILGVRNLDVEDILDTLELTEDGFIDDGTFQETTFEKDKETIVNFYKQRGYLDAELEDANWDLRWKNPNTQEARVIVVTYKVKEGDQYFFNGYDIEFDSKLLNCAKNPTKPHCLAQKTVEEIKSLQAQYKDKKPKDSPLFDKDNIKKFFEYTDSDVGEIFDFGKYTRDKQIVNFLYSQQGYIFTRVIPEKTTILLTKERIDELERHEKQVNAKKADADADYYNIERLRSILESNPEKKGKKFIHTSFLVVEGNKGYIENIIVKGNQKTLSKVIKRELLIQEGQLFNAALVQRSRERVFNLGFFKNVNVDARPGSEEGKMNLVIEVEEQPTGTISLGGGFGTQTGFSIFTEVSENNLNGTGQRVSGRLELGPQRTAIEGSWREPWLFDEPWALTLSGSYFNRQLQIGSFLGGTTSVANEVSTYETNSLALTVALEHRFWINWGHYHTFSPVYSIATNPSSLAQDDVFLLVKQGWQVKNTVTNGMYYDNRDNVFNPTQGTRADFNINFVGSVLGGNDHFNRYNPSLLYYWWPVDFTFFNLIRKNALRRWRVVFEHKLSMSFTHETSPIYSTQDKNENRYIEVQDQLYIGGVESLRGWELFDRFYPAAWVDGGSHRILYGTELRIPVEPSLFWLVLFFDAGALYDNPDEVIISSTSASVAASTRDAQLNIRNLSMGYFRYSWGFGFRLQIPILPLRIYLAKRLIWDNSRGWFRNHPVDDSFQFVFGIGDRRF